jgi:hypothetical protein
MWSWHGSDACPFVYPRCAELHPIPRPNPAGSGQRVGGNQPTTMSQSSDDGVPNPVLSSDEEMDEDLPAFSLTAPSGSAGDCPLRALPPLFPPLPHPSASFPLRLRVPYTYPTQCHMDDSPHAATPLPGIAASAVDTAKRAADGEDTGATRSKRFREGSELQKRTEVRRHPDPAPASIPRHADARPICIL